MGLVQALEYELPVPGAVQRAMWRISSSRPGAWLFARSLPRVDKFVLRMSRGQVTLAGITAGIPVLTITTTGARSGLRRTTPLLGVPFGGDIAVIGTNFGQAGTPGWYYNLRAQPRAEVSYRNRSVTAAAREADADERQAILGQARKIYGGYDAYARRITGRQIPVMILSG
jgi:deazaflavin-dependent oxidoreductase (nitroreductase family)